MPLAALSLSPLTWSSSWNRPQLCLRIPFLLSVLQYVNVLSNAPVSRNAPFSMSAVSVADPHLATWSNNKDKQPSTELCAKML